MKKLFLVAAAILIASGITSCKKSQDETNKNEAQSSETSVSDNTGATTVNDNSAEDTVGDPSGVTYIVGFVDNLTKQLGSVKSQNEFMEAISIDPKLTAEQRAYVLTASDKAKIKDALSKETDVLIPLAIKYNILTESQAKENRKEMMTEIENATTLGDIF